MELLESIVHNVGLGIATASSITNLFYCFLGVLLGTFIGVIPGIGPLAAIALIFPVTYHLEPTTALIMLAGLYYGAAYGGSITSILLNTPGDPASAITCLDGYPMAKQGRAGVALLVTTVGSFVGASFGIIAMMVFSPMIVSVAVQFQSAEYFSLMLLGLVTASTIAEGSVLKGLAMVTMGLIGGVVGLDNYTGVPRFTFGFFELYDGVSVAVVAMALFAVVEIVASVGSVPDPATQAKITFRSMVPTRDDVKRSTGAVLRGTGIGAFFGIMPGSGGFLASLMSYAVEKRVAKDPTRFGRGAIEGVAAPETANNAAGQTSFIPTLTLGIPGNAVMAIMLGALLVHGIVPGPRLLTDHPDMFWGLVMSFWIGNILLVILNIPLIGIWIRILKIPYHLLYPAILMFVCIGVYSASNTMFDVWLVIVVGALGYAMRLFGFSPAPLVLGFVLGPMLEDHFRRAMLLSRGHLSVFIERPISGAIIFATLAILAWGVWGTVRRPAEQT